MKLGLGPAHLAAITRQLAEERINPRIRWKRVALQPLVNFGFFRKLYRQHRPHFATFHTNHVAHYQHTYWKAMEPEKFRPLETTGEESETYGPAIEYGYTTADRLLGRMMALLDPETVLVVASSMGQKPFHSTLKGGKQIAQWRSLDALLDLLGVRTDGPRYFDDVRRIRHPCAARCRARPHPRHAGRVIHRHAGPEDLRLRLDRRGRPRQPEGLRGRPHQGLVHRPLPCRTSGTPSPQYDDVIYNTGHLEVWLP